MKSQRPLQPLTPDDLAFIRALADEHSVGLPQRCARYRRRWHRVARATIGVAAAVALVVIMAQPQPDGQYLSDPSYRAEALHSLDQARLASR